MYGRREHQDRHQSIYQFCRICSPCHRHHPHNIQWFQPRHRQMRRQRTHRNQNQNHQYCHMNSHYILICNNYQNVDVSSCDDNLIIVYIFKSKNQVLYIWLGFFCDIYISYTCLPAGRQSDLLCFGLHLEILGQIVHKQ